MARGRVLVVEDEASIRRGVADALRLAGYEVETAGDGRTGLAMALEGSAGGGLGLVLLDVMLPGLDGVSVLRELRGARPGLGVIMLTARGTEEDRVRGLRLGADDYVVKPFSVAELLARVEAVLRRRGVADGIGLRLRIGGVVVDLSRREVVSDGSVSGTLTAREAELLAYLARHRDRAVGREELLERVWGLDPRGMETRTVDMTVARVRTQAGRVGEGLVSTVRGKGYMLGESVAVETASGGGGGGCGGGG